MREDKWRIKWYSYRPEEQKMCEFILQSSSRENATEWNRKRGLVQCVRVCTMYMENGRNGKKPQNIRYVDERKQQQQPQH